MNGEKEQIFNPVNSWAAVCVPVKTKVNTYALFKAPKVTQKSYRHRTCNMRKRLFCLPLFTLREVNAIFTKKISCGEEFWEASLRENESMVPCKLVTILQVFFHFFKVKINIHSCLDKIDILLSMLFVFLNNFNKFPIDFKHCI